MEATILENLSSPLLPELEFTVRLEGGRYLACVRKLVKDNGKIVNFSYLSLDDKPYLSQEAAKTALLKKLNFYLDKTKNQHSSQDLIELIPFSPEAEGNKLLMRLKHPDSEIRWRTVHHIANLGSFFPKGALLEMLNDEDEDVRIEAAIALGKLGDVRALETLIAALKIGWYANTVNSIIAKLGTVAVLPLLEILQDENSKIRQSAAYILGAIRDKRAIAPLLEILDKGDTYAQTWAAFTLGYFDDAQVTHALLEKLKSCEIEVLNSIAIRAFNSLRKSNQLIEALTTLIEKGDDNRRAAAIEILGSIGDTSRIDLLLTTLKDRNNAIRQKSAKALGDLGDVQAVEALIAALSDENSEVRLTATTALGKIRVVLDLNPLIARLSDFDRRVRTEAIGALGEIGDARALTPLIIFLATLTDSEEDDFVRVVLAKALGQIGDRRALQALLELQQRNKRSTYLSKEMLPETVSWAIKNILYKQKKGI